MRCYDRFAAVDYAKEWALVSNPRFNLENEEKIAGFLSECLYSGSATMNMAKGGWFYKNHINKSESWNSVEKLAWFILNNKGTGPFGKIVGKNEVMPGDIAMFSMRGENKRRSGIITSTESGIRICSYCDRAFMRAISCYNSDDVIYLHILGVAQG